MPLFEYVCKKCGHQFEALVLGSTRPACPKCKSKSLKQEFSAFAVARGSGASSGGSKSPASSCGASSGGGG